MALFNPADRRLVEAVSQLVYCNPFLPERIGFEQAALGEQFDPGDAHWNIRPESIGEHDHPNVLLLLKHAEAVLDAARQKLDDKPIASDAEIALYEDLVLFVLYHRYREGFDRTMLEALERGTAAKRVAAYDSFSDDALKLLRLGGAAMPMADDLPHYFAAFFQIRRAFYNIFQFILGASEPTVRLRASVWQSIFSHDMRRYRRVLYDRMADFTTLVTGPSGTGKELIARAVGLSRYIPFDPKTRSFTADFAGSFLPLNLSALTPTLIESELFGHVRGTFTGAVGDRQGWLEICPPLGTVFLDEIGELDGGIQVKLLRVLQSRTFSRIGETTQRRFEGKIIAATNRDLAQQMRHGVFREDLYYRLCSDLIVTPSLRQRLDSDPPERRELIMHIAGRLVGDDAADVADEVVRWIDENLGDQYAWPGNVRELEQCVRNVLIRKSYHPTASAAAGDARQAIAASMLACELTVDELLQRYCTLMYLATGSYEEAGRRLGLDRRTVKAKLDEDLLAKLRRGT
jgi:transcriptional regulator with AAA-type ATPase domain